MRLFPELKGKIESGMLDEEIYMILEKEAKPTLEKYYNESTDDQKYQSIWDEVSDDIMKSLEEKLQIKWPFNSEIICKICLLPVC